MKKETTEQMTSFTVNVNVKCKVIRLRGSRVAVWFLTVILNGSFLPNYAHGLGKGQNT